MSEHFSDGAWLSTVERATREIHCPGSGSQVATVAEGEHRNRAAHAAEEHS